MTGYFEQDACDLGEFISLTSKKEDGSALNFADDVQKNIPLYDMAGLRDALEAPDHRKAVMTEWAEVLRSGPGVLVLKAAYADTGVIDEATQVYEKIIAKEKAGSGGSGDHFAAAGANDRVWNSLQKLCEEAPEVYLRYFASTPIAAVCEAWLGPNYQMTAQVNLVHPGGEAQKAHRDYHLGFQSAEISAQYPAHVHDLSPVLTLQGGIAHCDMPVESGPTKLMPFSQAYRPGYAAWRRDDFRAHFEEHHVQIPLEKGDALFFSPALFHAAGSNLSQDIHRMVNLLQISSAFGRAMETIDRAKMCRLLYPHALKAYRSGSLPAAELSATIASTAEGYSFPTNLDRDPPIGGLAPETQAALFHRAMSEEMSEKDFAAALSLQADRQKA